jgi:hypothetical protein
MGRAGALWRKQDNGFVLVCIDLVHDAELAPLCANNKYKAWFALSQAPVATACALSQPPAASTHNICSMCNHEVQQFV